MIGGEIMFNRIKRQCRKLVQKATPITREQYLKLTRVLKEINLPYTTFFDCEDGITDNKIIHLSNDVFIVKDYFSDFRLPNELVESIN